MDSIATRSDYSRRALAAFGALAVCLVAFSGNASATPADPAPSARVAYGDLNLARQQDNIRLYARIGAAARAVCSADRVDNRELARLAEVRACVARATAQAVHDVHSPQLAAIHEARQSHG